MINENKPYAVVKCELRDENASYNYKKSYIDIYGESDPITKEEFVSELRFKGLASQSLEVVDLEKRQEAYQDMCRIAGDIFMTNMLNMLEHTLPGLGDVTLYTSFKS